MEDEEKGLNKGEGIWYFIKLVWIWGIILKRVGKGLGEFGGSILKKKQ